MPKFKLNFTKKLFLFILSSILFLNSMAVPFAAVKAQGLGGSSASQGSSTSNPSGESESTWYNQDFKSWLEKVDDVDNPSEIFGERYTSAQVQWIIYSLLSFILHTQLPSDVVSCVFSNTVDLSTCKDAIENFLKPIEENTTALEKNKDKNLLSLVFATNRPISGISYIKGKVEKFGIIPTVNAQNAGFGFDALEPIQDMWRASRDVAFGLFVLVAIIFAFMIMFRVKINPQTVITVQSTIPKVIFALIAVTFSYAIAGLLIDLMYVVIGISSLVLAPFSTAGGNLDPTFVFNFLTFGQPLGGAQIGIFGFLMILTAPMFLGLVILALLVSLTGALPGLQGIWLLLIPLIIVAIIIIWISIKTIWALFKAFANIILLTIFGPLQIAMGVLIPNFGFSQWLRSYISHLSVFVVTGVIGYMSLLFMMLGFVSGFRSVTGGGDIVTLMLSMVLGAQAVGGWAASQIVPTGSWPPLLGGGGDLSVGLLFLGVSFVLFTMIPKATEVVQAFMAGKPFAYGNALGEALNPMGLTGYAGAFGVGKVESRLRAGMVPDSPEDRAAQLISQSIQKRMTGGR